MDVTAKLADRLGTTTEMLTGLQHAASIAGISTDQMSNSLQFMNKTLGYAIAGGQEQNRVLASIGLTAQELAGIDAGQAFIKIADGIAQLSSKQEQAYATATLFGRGAVGLLNVINSGTGSIQAMITENEKLGGSFSRIDAANMEEVNDSLTRMGTAFGGVFRQIGVAAAPYITEFVGIVTKGFIWFRETAVPWIGDAIKKILDSIRGLVLWTSPMISAWTGMIAAAFGIVKTIAKNLWDSIGHGVSWLGDILGISRNTFTGWGNTVIVVFAAMEYAFKNWELLLSRTLTSAQYRIISWANVIEHFFTVVIPTYLSWLERNWKNIFVDIGNFTYTILTNLGENIAAVFMNLPGLISGAVDFSEIWTPMLDGFRVTMEALPEIAARQEGALEKSLRIGIEEMDRQIAEGFGEHLAKRWEEINARTDSISNFFDSLKLPSIGDMKLPELGLNPDDRQIMKKSVEGKGAAALERGTVAAYSASFKAQMVTSERIQTKIAGATAQSAQTLKSIENKLGILEPMEIMSIN